MNIAQQIRRIGIYVGLLTILTQCDQRDNDVSPQLAGLVGTWRLVAPDTTFRTTLTVALDTANPPHDVTPLLASGQSALNAYALRLFATVDGTMSSGNWSNTERSGTSAAMTFEQIYFQNLRVVVRYQMPTANRLYLYHGGTQPHVLTYEKID